MVDVESRFVHILHCSNVTLFNVTSYRVTPYSVTPYSVTPEADLKLALTTARVVR